MKYHGQLVKYDAHEGLNYIVQSKLTSYESISITDRFSIKTVKKGVEHYKINGVDYEVSADNFLIVSPGQKIEIIIDSSSEVEGLCYFLDNDLIHQTRFAHTHSIGDNLENIDPGLDDVFDNLPINLHCTYLEQALKVPVTDDLSKEEVSVFLMSLAEHMVLHQHRTAIQLRNIEGKSSVTKKELYKRIQKGRQYIHDNSSGSLSLKAVGRAAGLSEYYYHRNFRNYYNQTPYQYHHELRMRKAKNLIGQGRLSKKEAAFQCGFTDVKYFSKTYKKWAQVKS